MHWMSILRLCVSAGILAFALYLQYRRAKLSSDEKEPKAYVQTLFNGIK